MMDVLLSDFDWESSSESGSSELEEIEFSYGGQAQSIFSSLEESLGKIDDFLSFERGFLHGDIVCSVTDPSGQMGRVININMLVDLENVRGRYIKEVDSKKLLKIRSLSLGDYVVQGTWVGRVDKVVDLVCVIFDDGSKYEITAVDQENLVPVSPNLLEDSQFSYYPGQRVRVRLSHLPKSARWLCGNWRENQEEGTVSAVEAGLVYVDWVASALMGSDLSSPAPPHLQDPKNLILLSCFPHATWRLGDWCMFPVASHKGTMEQVLLNTSASDVIKDHKKLERGFQSSNLTPTLDEIFAIVKTKTKVDVVWQDGTCSMAVDSRMVVPLGVVTAHEFWPEQFVMEKDIANCQRWGVVCTVDAKQRTAKVRWKTRANSEANGFDEDQVEETVSAYELVEHPDFGFSFGDVVFRVVKGHFWDQTDKDHVSTANTVATENAVKHSNSGEDQNEYSEKDHLSSVGVVTGFKDGNVEVKWATGFTTKVAPYEIYHIDKYGSSATTAVSYEENSVELNQEMIEYDKQSSVELEKDLTSEDYEKYPRESSSFSLPRAAIGFFTSIAESLFGYHGSTSLSGPVTSDHNSEDQSESEILLKEEVLGTPDLSELGPSELQSTVNEHLKQEGKENEELQDSKLQNAGTKSSQFRQFDIVTDCSDHHFFAASKGLAQSQVKRGWLKKVQEEWSILESNLPETIYIRVYEERMDLLRAALVGAPGTPYHDGLFFFDILLPSEYPYEPPLVHYNSGGLRLNPNLYESGKVCLSLLNTWTGTGSEVWNPQSSTILQVLLSLQALVLNEKPYFNEAGYDKQMGRTEGEKNSVSYNENAFLMTWKSMLYILRQPPKHFEALIEEHLRRRAQQILLACKTYMEGAPMGFNSRCAENEHENPKESSTGFKIMLGKLFPRLTEAFSGMGIDSSQSVEPTVDLDTTNSSILPCE